MSFKIKFKNQYLSKSRKTTGDNTRISKILTTESGAKIYTRESSVHQAINFLSQKYKVRKSLFKKEEI